MEKTGRTQALGTPCWRMTGLGRRLGSAPIAKRCVHECESCHRRRVGTQDAWAKRDAPHECLRCEELTFAVIKAALGSDQQRERAGAERPERGQRIGNLAVLITEDQAALPIPVGEGG